MILSEPRLLILIYYFSDSKEKLSDAVLVFPLPPGGQVIGQVGFLCLHIEAYTFLQFNY